MDARSKLAIKYDALLRLAAINTCSGRLPLYIVTEYPKSGGSWVSQLVSDYFQVPFPRNVPPKFESSVMHGHNLYSPFMKNVICVFRDGRDVMVSAYFHMLFQNERNSPILVKKTRHEVDFDDYDNVEKNLPAFIKYLFVEQSRITRPFQFTWPQFYKSWNNTNATIIKYESLVADGVGELSSAILHLTGKEADRARVSEIIEKYSFENQSKRKPGEENTKSFLRSGKPGDWRNKFTREAALMFDHYAGEELIALGYEKDRSWVNDFE